MSFYGRINRTDRVSFVTDKIYPNRKEMDDNVSTDQVYIGRYVLVEYDQNGDSESYSRNYDIDKENYPDMRRGYDSTVWQKIYADGVEKYVNVAELNSVVPTLSVVADAPTLNPLPPHFDVNSNTAYYQLHVQPSWGFKVKEAESADKSDATITYDTVEWVEGAETLNEINDKTYDAAIFFNKDAFRKDLHYNNLVKEEDDKIEITLSSSGRQYNENHSNPSNLDTYELSIMLPTLGEAMSEAWDIMYGPGEIDKEDESISHRFTQIGWDVDGGPRLVQSSRQPDNSGFEYDVNGASSMAGCINSVHDLMGKIIVNDSGNQTPDNTLKDALVNRIYYRDRKYWMKNIIPDYKPVEGDIIIENMREFGDNYYYKTGNNYYLELEGYQNGNTYYSLENIEPITFYGSKWEPNKYYKKYFNKGVFAGYEKESSSNPDETIEYFDIKGVTKNTKTVISHTAADYYFFPGEYYSTEEGSFYQAIFPTIQLTEESDSEARGKGLFYLFEKDGKFGYLPFNDTVSYDSIFKNEDGTPRLAYWENYKIETATQPGSDKLVVTYDFNGAIKTEIKTIQFEPEKFYSNVENKKWVLLNSVNELTVGSIYYHIDELGKTTISLKEPFYEPNTYYYIDGLDYIMGIDNEQRPNIQYYKIGTINQIGTDITFYEPNKYYYENEAGNKVLDTSPTITEGRVYYYDTYTRYVISDKNGIYPINSVWNEQIIPVPEGVELGYKVDKYQWKELKGFSRTLNTINGLILKINQIIKFDDKITRDTSTVAGCINKLNDIIWKFDKLEPNNIAIIDENGQFTSAQTIGDNWINITVNNNNDDKIIITHKNAVSKNTRNEAGKTPKFGETFEIEDWVFDDKGHQTNVSTHTITIPKGSLNNLTATSSSVLTGISMVPETGAITQTNANVGTLLLTGYDNSTAGATIASEDSLNGAVKKLEDRIIAEEKSRDNAIKNLDVAANTSTTKFISTISQTDGKIAVERAAAGTLVLSDSNNAIATQTADAIKGSDSILTAFGKAEAQVQAEIEAREKDIKTLTDNLNKEKQEREAAINAEKTARENEIQSLDATLPVEFEGSQIIDSITQVNGKLTQVRSKYVGELTLSKYEELNSSEKIAYTDTINGAFGKLQGQINKHNTSIDTNTKAIEVLNGSGEGSVSYKIAQVVAGADTKFDTLKEISDWIINDDLGVAKINSDITTLYARSDGINKEVKENYVRKEELNNKLVEVNSEINTINNKFDTKIKEVDNVLNTHTNDIETLYARNNGINKEVKENYVRKEELNNELVIINTKQEVLNNTVENHTSAIENLYVRNDGINKEVKDNYVRKEDFEATVKMLLEKITYLDNKVAELEKLIQ